MKTIKRIGLLLTIILLILPLGCEVVCPECPPPEVIVTAPNVTAEITIEPQIECPNPEVNIELDPEIDVELPEPKIYLDVEIPEIECPEVNVSVKVWPYEDIRYNQELLEVVMPNHLREINYYPTSLKEIYPSYQGNGLWIIRCKFQVTGGGIFWHSFTFSEWTDDFVE